MRVKQIQEREEREEEVWPTYDNGLPEGASPRLAEGQQESLEEGARLEQGLPGVRGG